MTRTNRDIPGLSDQEHRNFWKCVDKTPGHGPNGDCWIWTGGKARCGYGHFNLKRRKRQCSAHRVMHFLTNPDFNPALNVLHSCDFGHGGCVRPEHLFQGTQADNLRDMRAKGREARGAKHGSKTHPEALRRGSDCSWARLNEDQVREIRVRAAQGESHSVLAQEYPVTRPMITMIVNRKRWTQVE